MKQEKFESDLAECEAKLYRLLREYNCFIEWDDEAQVVALVDKDTKQFIPI